MYGRKVSPAELEATTAHRSGDTDEQAVEKELLWAAMLHDELDYARIGEEWKLETWYDQTHRVYQELEDDSGNGRISILFSGENPAVFPHSFLTPGNVHLDIFDVSFFLRGAIARVA